MECEFCGKILNSKGALEVHQRKTQYCLKIQGKNVEKNYKCYLCEKGFILKNILKNHEKICKDGTKVIRIRKENIEIMKRNKILEEENKINKNKIEILEMKGEGMGELKELLKIERENYKKLEKIYQDFMTKSLEKSMENSKEITLSAIKHAKPINNKTIQINNYIEKMEPITDKNISDCVPMLTIDHHVKGVEGYAEYAIEYPFKDKIMCVDTSRNKIKYKDANGKVINDVGFKKMMIKFCESVKDKSLTLSEEHREKEIYGNGDIKL